MINHKVRFIVIEAIRASAGLIFLVLFRELRRFDDLSNRFLVWKPTKVWRLKGVRIFPREVSSDALTAQVAAAEPVFLLCFCQ